MKNFQVSRLISVVVTYNPDISKLEGLVDALYDQVDHIVLVDNASGNMSNDLFQKDKVTFISLSSNYGIAYAQNIGIKKAIECQCSHILLMDQDSIPNSGMVEELKKGFVESDVIAVGPVTIDDRSGEKSFFVSGGDGWPRRVHASDTRCLVEAAFLISSGMLIDATKLMQVKGKRSSYFIDHVDTEWTIRARGRGYRLLGVPSAVMRHALGDKVKQIWFFGMRQVAYHSPLRDYYMFRNTILMLRDVKMGWLWKAHFIWRLCQFSAYFLIFSTERKDRFVKMSLGVLHGVRNIRGKLLSNSLECEAIPKSSIDP